MTTWKPIGIPLPEKHIPPQDGSDAPTPVLALFDVSRRVEQHKNGGEVVRGDTSFMATMAPRLAPPPMRPARVRHLHVDVGADPFTCSPDDLQSIIPASGLAVSHRLAVAHALRAGQGGGSARRRPAAVARRSRDVRLHRRSGVAWANGVSKELAEEAETLFTARPSRRRDASLAVTRTKATPTLPRRAPAWPPLPTVREPASRCRRVAAWTVLPTLSSAGS